jgi:hypothetical protein
MGMLVPTSTQAASAFVRANRRIVPGTDPQSPVVTSNICLHPCNPAAPFVCAKAAPMQINQAITGKIIFLYIRIWERNCDIAAHLASES